MPALLTQLLSLHQQSFPSLFSFFDASRQRDTLGFQVKHLAATLQQPSRCAGLSTGDESPKPHNSSRPERIKFADNRKDWIICTLAEIHPALEPTLKPSLHENDLRIRIILLEIEDVLNIRAAPGVN